MLSDIDILHREILKTQNEKSTPKRKKIRDDEEGNYCYLDYNADAEFERTVTISVTRIMSGEFC